MIDLQNIANDWAAGQALEYARETGLTFGEAWDTESLHSAALEVSNA